MLKKHHRFMWGFTKSFVLSLRRPVFIYLSTLSFTAIFIFALLFFMIEKDSNASVTSFFDSFYYTITVMTGVGLGDIHSSTFLGKLVSIVMMLSGTVIFVCFTGVMAASILEIENSRKNNSSKD